MNELLTMMYIALLIFALGWVITLGAHPNSSRTTFGAIIMTIAVMVIIGCVVLTLLNLFILATQ